MIASEFGMSFISIAALKTCSPLGNGSAPAAKAIFTTRSLAEKDR